MKGPRVLLADDHATVLEGFKRLLQPTCEVAEVPRAGHMVFEDNPDAFIRIASTWLADHVELPRHPTAGSE